MIATHGGYVDTVKLLLDRGASVEEKDNVSTRRCITTHMHVCIKWSMSWMNIVRRILMRCDVMRWDETRSQMIVDRWWGWCMDSMWFQHSTFNILYLFGDFLWNEMTFLTCVILRII